MAWVGEASGNVTIHTKTDGSTGYRGYKLHWRRILNGAPWAPAEITTAVPTTVKPSTPVKQTTTVEQTTTVKPTTTVKTTVDYSYDYCKTNDYSYDYCKTNDYSRTNDYRAARRGRTSGPARPARSVRSAGSARNGTMPNQRPGAQNLAPFLP